MSTNPDKQISLRFTETEYQQLSALATAQGLSITAFMKQQLANSLGLQLQTLNAVTLNDVDQAAEKLTAGQQFKIKQLFKLDDWKAFTKASRLSVGRTFYTNVANGNFKDKYIFVQKDSDNAAIYERL
ncbi:DUF1413 domain-containing protein [Bacillus sp. Hm123]|uniref:DUF1413 domain-containing protein n=1 Tax=Bacillus sp. Hm123 TaxID=3450745 RepID=UPI003F43747F